MAYAQYTKCVTPAAYSGTVNYTAGAIASVIAAAATGDFGVAVFGFVLTAIAFCRWWLYGRLVCLGGNSCAIGLATSVSPPQLKTGLNREDTDYGVDLLLAPSTLYEDVGLASLDAQGSLLAESPDPAFRSMMSNFPLGFQGEADPFSDLINPVGQSPNATFWAPNNFYLPGAVVQDSNNNLQSCTTQGLSGGAAPNWATVAGQTTADGFINWNCLGPWSVLSQQALNSIGLFSPAAWQASSNYSYGDLLLDSNGMLQSAAASGTTGTSAPNWETTLGQITPDGTLSWRNIGVGRTWSDTGGDSTTTYAPNDQIIDANGNLQICSVGGNSGGVAPNWGTVPGDTTADGQVTWTAQVNPAWVGGVSVALGAWLIDSNGKTQRCTVPGISGATEPAWNSTVGESTQDSAATWTCAGKFTTGIGTLEVEFEGGGMYDLYIALLVASPFAAAAAAVGWIPFLGWLLALLLSLIAGAIAGIGYAIGHGDTADPNADDPTIGTIFPGQDVLIVMGAWIYDSAHSGWNELHPVLHCQKIAKVPPADLATGDPWANLPQFSAANVAATIAQISATNIGWCPLIGEAQSGLTAVAQALPQNGWSIHPDVDGCVPPPENIQ